jgi:hypothetical protein
VHLGHVVDPDGPARLADREDRAAERRELWLTSAPDPDGLYALRGRLDGEGRALLATVLDPLAAPRPAHDGVADLRPPARRRADALVEVLRRSLDGGGCRPPAGSAPT